MGRKLFANNVIGLTINSRKTALFLFTEPVNTIEEQKVFVFRIEVNRSTNFLIVTINLIPSFRFWYYSFKRSTAAVCVAISSYKRHTFKSSIILNIMKLTACNKNYKFHETQLSQRRYYTHISAMFAFHSKLKVRLTTEGIFPRIINLETRLVGKNE